MISQDISGVLQNALFENFSYMTMLDYKFHSLSQFCIISISACWTSMISSQRFLSSSRSEFSRNSAMSIAAWWWGIIPSRNILSSISPLSHSSIVDISAIVICEWSSSPWCAWGLPHISENIFFISCELCSLCISVSLWWLSWFAHIIIKCIAKNVSIIPLRSPIMAVKISVCFIKKCKKSKKYFSHIFYVLLFTEPISKR